MNILVTGASGFVGQGIMKACPGTVAAPSLRNATADFVKRVVEESEAEVIIHTAAVSDIGMCQADPEGSRHANVRIPCFLAEAARGRKLVCFSSDQVYSACEAEGPYPEETVKPGNLYAEQKLEMEKRVLDLLPSAVMLRAEWMYDEYEKKSNYFMDMLKAEGRIGARANQFRGVTYLKEVTENMEKVMTLPGGVYNFGGETTLPMIEITRKFAAYLGKNLIVEAEPGGHNLWMDCGKARTYGVVFSDVLAGLIRCADDHPELIRRYRSR